MMEKEVNLPTVYDPQQVEGKWYQYWLDKDYFRADVNSDKPPFTIVIPPPNVTGSLHMGHALNNTIQDIVIRRKRMQGYDTLWLPGTDHAGIATQNVVERQLAKEGLSRYDLGREKFIERVWEWKHQYGSTIINQLKRLGTSCDWSRERFTMDEGCSEAVKEIFLRLFAKGLIYRDSYIINWCPRCFTALSDIEVEHQDDPGHLWYVRYPTEDGADSITIATTRPETILGDVAVAVHPEDGRYRHLIGKTLVLPIIGRKIPVIADDYVEREFGTGAVKVTPAHDPNDFAMGVRHNLPRVVVMNGDGTINENGGKYAGLDRYACRKAILEDLEREGYLVKTEEHPHSVGHCSRCDTVIEPLLSKQWFVRMKPLAEPAIQAVREGKTRFVPERFTKIYLDWLENIRDWCISRQIWWGHRIPVWYCQDCGAMIGSKEEVKVCPKCGSDHVEQDPDVLDTWFSSALWPFSTLGWPKQTPELARYYPNSLLVTGYDIIFFWVARMMFFGLEGMGEVPFPEVCLNGLVRDAHGKKMSKSRGNTVDPLEIIDQYGADTLRFTLITSCIPGADLRLYTERFESTRNFCNKIWNAARFVLMNLKDFAPAGIEPAKLELALEDRWILSRYHRLVGEVDRLLDLYEQGEAGKRLYEFIWNEFCDWYIELVKPRLYQAGDPQDRRTAQYVLWYVLENTLALLHPFMPFITEEIWQSLPHEGESIMVKPWPQGDPGMIDQEAEARMNTLMDVIKAIRNLRAEMNVSPGKKAEVILHPDSVADASLLEQGTGHIRALGGVSNLQIAREMAKKPDQAVSALAGGIEVYMPLKGLIDLDKEIARLKKEQAELDKEINRLEGKLSNAGFLVKAPREVVEKEKAKLADYRLKWQKIAERLALLVS